MDLYREKNIRQGDIRRCGNRGDGRDKDMLGETSGSKYQLGTRLV